MEPDPNRASTAGRVSYPHRLRDGTETQTSQRFVWELDIHLNKGCARGMWPPSREGLHRYPSFYNHDVCGKQANILGMPGRGTDERINAAPVVVGTGARHGRVTAHLGITSNGLATESESTQLAGRGGSARRSDATGLSGQTRRQNLLT